MKMRQTRMPLTVVVPSLAFLFFWSIMGLLVLLIAAPCRADNTSPYFVMSEQDKASLEEFTRALEQEVTSITTSTTTEAITPRDLQQQQPQQQRPQPIQPDIQPDTATDSPTESPAPSPSPSEVPTASPTVTSKPTNPPTANPTESPAPSPSPSDTPTIAPSAFPSISPTLAPSVSEAPSQSPSISPQPSNRPSELPSNQPSLLPSQSPSLRPSLISEVSATTFQVALDIDSTLNANSVRAFRQVTADWIETVNVDGSMSNVFVTVTGQELMPVSQVNTDLSNKSGEGTGRRLQEEPMALVVEFEAEGTYSGPVTDIDLYEALNPIIQSKPDDWMRELANAAPVFEPLRPASMAAIFGEDQGGNVPQGMSKGGYVVVILIAITALALGIAASVFVVRGHKHSSDEFLAKSMPSPALSHGIMEEYPLNEKPYNQNNHMIAPVSEHSENSPHCGIGGPSPSSCCSSATGLDYLGGCGGGGCGVDQGMVKSNKDMPPASPNTMEKGRKDSNSLGAIAGRNRNNNNNPSSSLFDGIPFRSKPPMADDISSQPDPPSFSEVDFGNNRGLFDPVAKSLLASHVPPSNHARPRDPSVRGVHGNAGGKQFDPTSIDRTSDAGSSRRNIKPPIAERIAQFEKISDPGSSTDGGRGQTLTKRSGGTLGATAVDRSAVGSASDLSSHARDFFNSILGGGQSAAATAPAPAAGSDAQQSATTNSNSNASSAVSQQAPPIQRKPSYDSLLRRGGAGLYDVFAPAGPIGIVVDTTSNGPAVHSLRNTSPMVGLISPGDLIVGLDDEDTRAMTAATLTRLMAQKANQKERKITLLTMDGY